MLSDGPGSVRFFWQSKLHQVYLTFQAAAGWQSRLHQVFLRVKFVSCLSDSPFCVRFIWQSRLRQIYLTVQVASGFSDSPNLVRFIWQSMLLQDYLTVLALSGLSDSPCCITLMWQSSSWQKLLKPVWCLCLLIFSPQYKKFLHPLSSWSQPSEYLAPWVEYDCHIPTVTEVNIIEWSNTALHYIAILNYSVLLFTELFLYF